MKSLILEEAPDLLWSTVTLFSHVHQSVSTVGGAVGLVWPRDVQETRSPRQQDHLLKVISATAAEVHGSSAGVCGGTACVEQRWVDLSIGSELSHIWRCVCLYYRGVCVLRGSRVHDAGGGGAGAGASIVMVHPEVVAEFMSHDGGERRNVLIGELRRQTGVCVCVCVCVCVNDSILRVLWWISNIILPSEFNRQLVLKISLGNPDARSNCRTLNASQWSVTVVCTSVGTLMTGSAHDLLRTLWMENIWLHVNKSGRKVIANWILSLVLMT